MTKDRPNPDQLLARVMAEEGAPRRGRLKIFLGYAAGVGKTYAMLEAAQRERAQGLEVVVGYVEPHGRPETEALLTGLEVLPPREVQYHGVTLKEFDLDAALKRHPRLILVDELAHTNAEGLRHAKRWQDVQELLGAGIDVYTTLNVQHVESLNDVIAQITSIVVRETLPDSILERADDIELVDLTPEELIERLRAGKVYIPEQARQALEHYFQKANLVALRELVLRQAVQRLSKDVEAARKERAGQPTWATNERLLVCVGPSPTSAKLIRTAKRMAAAFGAEWIAVAVEPYGASAASSIAHQRVVGHLRLAERLGAETHVLIGRDVPQTIIDFARSRNVTKIVIGKTLVPACKRLLFSTVVDALLERSGDIDVYVIRGEKEETRRLHVHEKPGGIVWTDYLGAALVVALCTLAGWLSFMAQLTEANTAMVFLLGVAYVAYRFGQGPAIAAAVVSVLVFDFFFIPPYLTFAVSDGQYLLTFAVMLVIGLIISALTARMKDQLQLAQQLESRTSALFRLTKQLSEIAGPEFLVRTAGQQLGEIFGGEIVLFVRDAAGTLQLRHGDKTAIGLNPINAVVAQWVADHDTPAGRGTDTLPNATAFFVPLIGSRRTVGVVGAAPSDPERLLDPDQRRLLETCASLIALAVERDQSVLEASEAEIRAQTEQLRNALLSSVSHDLRTPLAAIAGASSSLLDSAAETDSSRSGERRRLDDRSRRELLQTIVDESRTMSRLIDNLLDMTRLASGKMALNKQWHVLEEIVGSALGRLRRELKNHHIHVSIPADFPLLLLDGVLMEQVFFNLLENAAHYTPLRSTIEISARCGRGQVEIRFADNGPGLPPGTEARVFEKFFRGATPTADSRRGVGLGLAICQAVVEAHDGQISARNLASGGAEFTVMLPLQQPAPHVELDEVTAGR